MPIRPPIGCNFPTCKNAAQPHSAYCPEHQPKGKVVENYAQRMSARPYSHLYHNAAWTKHLRPFILTRDPLCRLQLTDLCKQHGGDASTVVHHVVDHKGNPALFYDRENCMGVCKPCHDLKTGEGPADGGPVATGEDGKQFVASENQAAIDKALENKEYLDDVTIP